MKNLMITILVSTLLSACGGSSSKTSSHEECQSDMGMAGMEAGMMGGATPDMEIAGESAGTPDMEIAGEEAGEMAGSMEAGVMGASEAGMSAGVEGATMAGAEG